MTHLGERVCDLVDGQLSPAEAEDAAAHLAGCPACRHEVDAARLLKQRLAGLAGPEPTGDFLSRLVGMGGPAGPLPPAPTPMPQGWRPVTAAMPPRMSLVGQRRPAVLAPVAAWRPPSRGLAMTVGALSLASVGVFAVAGAAGGPEPVPAPGRTVVPVANLVVPAGLRSPEPTPTDDLATSAGQVPVPATP
ncbi:MAG: zf-HC2 domain-containing protein [Kineosporiaceae bacterium]